jgi:hypothetical protein
MQLQLHDCSRLDKSFQSRNRRIQPIREFQLRQSVLHMLSVVIRREGGN